VGGRSWMTVGVRRFTPLPCHPPLRCLWVLNLRAIGQIRRGGWTGLEAAALDQVVRTHGLRETGHYDPRLVDMLIAGARAARPIP
jgi:hypothetical protein